MTVTLQAHGAGGSVSFSDPLSIPLGYTTLPLDCIVLCFGTFSQGTPNASGCGATWLVYQFGGSNPWSTILVGYGCTAGGTAVSVTGFGGAQGDYAFGVFAGVVGTVNPVRGVPATGRHVNTPAQLSSPLSYVPGDLLVGTAVDSASGGSYTGAAAWNGFITDNLIGQSNIKQTTTANYGIPTGGNSTGFTIGSTNSGDTFSAQAIALITSLPLQVMVV